LRSSEEFDRLVSEPHQHVSRIEVFIDGDIVEDTYYGGTHLLLDSGTVAFDRNAETRGSTKASLLDVDGTGKDILDPVNSPEVRPHRGIMIDGIPEWIPLGAYPVETYSVERRGNFSMIDIDGNDYSALVRWLPWDQPFIIPRDTDYFEAIRMVVDDRATRFEPVYNFGASELLTPDMIVQDSDDPWSVVMKLASAVGCEAYFDRYRVLNVQPIPDLDRIAPVFELVEGQQGITVSPITRDVSIKDMFNGVICRGEAPWLLFPISGEAWDEDPLSPTYRFGPFGEKPLKISDAMASTNAQCQVIAEAEYQKVRGVLEDVTFHTLPDPRIEVGDVISVSDEVLGVKGRLVIETLNVPLVTGGMAGTVRRRR